MELQKPVAKTDTNYFCFVAHRQDAWKKKGAEHDNELIARIKKNSGKWLISSARLWSSVSVLRANGWEKSFSGWIMRTFPLSMFWSDIFRWDQCLLGFHKLSFTILTRYHMIRSQDVSHVQNPYLRTNDHCKRDGGLTRRILSVFSD